MGRRRSFLLAVTVTAIALAWTVLDVREVVDQLDESRTGVAVLALVVAALALTTGGEDSATGGEVVPQVSVARLDGDGEFALGQLAAARTPTLLWFWAPT